MNPGNSQPDSLWNLPLPLETREYVPRLLALSAIVHDPELSTALLHPVANEPRVEVVRTDKRISPAKLVRSAGISRTELQTLNPALRHLDYPLSAGHNLLVPKHQAKQVAATILRLPEEPHGPYQHRIAYGESLSVIAARYGTSISALRKVNRLNGTLIHAGKTLIIPSGTRVPPHPRTRYRHTIRRGESLSVIAARYGTSVSALREVNRLNGTLIHAGKTLVIPSGTRVPPHHRTRHRHTISHGESLSLIAARYGTSVSALRKVNRLNGTLIHAGKTLVIPF